MTTTYTILNLGDSVDVDITSFSAPPKSSFKVVGQSPPDETDRREALYQKVTGDEEYPMTVRAGVYANKKANDGIGQTNVSVKITTYLRKEDDDDVLWTLPLPVTIAFNVPGTRVVPDGSDVIDLLNQAHAWMVPVVTGVLSELALDELKFGVVGGLAEHADSSSA
jgi:hypothetical protein